MRIRKHAKSSSLLHATSNLKPEAEIQAHVCPLNQSPWDVITTFSPPSSPMPPTPPPLQEWDNMLVDGYGSSMHSGSAAQSRGFNIGQELESKDVEDQIALCCKTDGKSWKCRRVAVKGNSLCEHHLAQVRSYYSNNSNNNTNTVQESDSKKKKKKKKKQETVETGTKPLEGINVNPRPTDKPKKALGSSSSSSSSNRYEFYYYSGFGPHWGRKRGGSRCNGDDNNNGDANITEHERHETSRRVAAADIDDDDDDDESDSNKSEERAAAHESAGLYIDEDDDGEEDEDVMGGQNVKKRPRKQVKARSLKSLM